MRGDCSASTCVLNMCYGMGVSVVAKERYYNDPLLAYRKHVMCYWMKLRFSLWFSLTLDGLQIGAPLPDGGFDGRQRALL